MVGIAARRGEYTTNVTLLCAGIALAAAPTIVIYVFFQRQIVDGIAVGAVKVACLDLSVPAPARQRGTRRMVVVPA